MLVEHGKIMDSLAPLIKEVEAISNWKYRTDPESDKTYSLREMDIGFPKDEVNKIIKSAQIYLGDGYANRIVLSCVPAGEQILPHTDDFGEEIRSKSKHCHIPLITNEDVVMGFDTGETHLKKGCLYSMDETKRHWVKNPSDVNRVHLLFAFFLNR